MRSSRWMPIAGWCLATATSIVLSSVALSPVLSAARAESGELPDIDQFPAPAAVAETSDAPASTPSPSPTTAQPARTTRPAQSATPSRTRSASPTGPAGTTRPTPSPTATKPATTTENGWTVTTSGGVKTYVRSFATEGGTAVVKMTGAGVVSLVTATPADGYRVEKTGSDTNLAVYFNETNHSFIIHAQWWNGAPFVEVSEVGS